MLVIAHHHISDPENFWGAAEKVTQHLPAGLKVHGVYPSTDGRTGTCLWEADSVADVQQFLDEHSGAYAKNYCYEVNVERAMNLPRVHSALASL